MLGPIQIAYPEDEIGYDVLAITANLTKVYVSGSNWRPIKVENAIGYRWFNALDEQLAKPTESGAFNFKPASGVTPEANSIANLVKTTIGDGKFTVIPKVSDSDYGVYASFPIVIPRDSQKSYVIYIVATFVCDENITNFYNHAKIGFEDCYITCDNDGYLKSGDSSSSNLIYDPDDPNRAISGSNRAFAAAFCYNVYNGELFHTPNNSPFYGLAIGTGSNKFIPTAYPSISSNIAGFSINYVSGDDFDSNEYRKTAVSLIAITEGGIGQITMDEVMSNLEYLNENSVPSTKLWGD